MSDLAAHRKQHAHICLMPDSNEGLDSPVEQSDMLAPSSTTNFQSTEFCNECVNMTHNILLLLLRHASHDMYL